MFRFCLIWLHDPLFFMVVRSCVWHMRRVVKTNRRGHKVIESNPTSVLSWPSRAKTRLLGRDLSQLRRGSALATGLALAVIGGFAISTQAAAQTLEWDAGNNAANGAVEGGAGTWDGATDNWTKNGGNSNIDWDPGSVAQFGGAGGLVTLTGVQVIDGLVFTGGNYIITPDVPASKLELDDASADFSVVNAGDTATINAAIIGAGGVRITGPGTIVFNGVNTYLGLTRINGAGTLQNNGDIGGAVNVSNGTLNNTSTGRIGGLVTNTSTVISTGALGGLTNSLTGAATVQGSINGKVLNENSASLIIDGSLDLTNHALENKNSATVSITAGQTTGITTLTNSSTALTGVSIASGASLGAVSVSNAAGSTIANSGTLTSTNAIQNSGTLSNAAGASIIAGIDNNGVLTSAGAITGNLTNSGAGTATLKGDLKGNILNQNNASLIVTGNLALDNNTLTNDGAAKISITTGEMHGISALTNNSTAATGVSVGVGAALTAGEIINKAAAGIVNNGTLTSQNKALQNEGTLVSTGKIVGGLTNSLSGSATVKGVLDGNALNQNSAKLNIDGKLELSDDTLDNTDSATIAITAGDTTGISTLTNSSKALTGISIADGASLTAGNVKNELDATIANGGKLVSQLGAVQNVGTLSNAATGTVTGGILNTGTLTSEGTLVGGLTNSASATLKGGLNGNILNQGSGSLTINGTLGLNSNTLTNSGSASVAVEAGETTGLSLLTNSSDAPTGIAIAAGAALTADNVKNDPGAKIQNSGKLTSQSGPIQNLGAISNAASGKISGGIVNSGTLVSAGALVGDLTNSASATLRGGLSGNIDNQGSGILLINGNLTADSNTLTNNGSASIAITAGTTSGILKLSNNASAPAGVSIASGATLAADDVSNAAVAAISNNGALTSKNVIQNLGALSNGVTGTISGGINNTGGLYSLGKLNGALTNSAGGQVSISGAVDGPVLNQESAGLTVIGDLDVKNNTFGITGASAVVVDTGAVTGISTLTNSSTAAPGLEIKSGASLTAANIDNKTGATVLNAGEINAVFANSGSLVNNGTVNGALTVSAGGSLSGTGGTLTSLLLDGGAVLAGSSQTVLGSMTQNDGPMAGGIMGPGSGAYLMNGGSLTGAVSNYASFVQTGGALAAGAIIKVGAFGSTGGTDAGANIIAPVRAAAVGGKILDLTKEKSSVENGAGGISFVSDAGLTLGSSGTIAVSTVTDITSAGPTVITVNGDIVSQNGIDAAAKGAGDINIKTLGAISTQSTAISMQTAGGAGFADILGDISVSGADGALAGAGNATFNIGSGASIKAASLLNSASGLATLNNAGLLDVQSLSAGGAGNVVINNLASGIVNLGGISLSTFGGTADAFINGGMLNVAGNVEFAGLDTFNNQSGGTLNMGNDAGGDVLKLDGSLNLGSSNVFMDINLAEPQNADKNDLIIIGGALTGDGAVIHLKDTSNMVPLIGFVGPTLISAGSIDPLSTFVVTGLGDAGFFEYELVQHGKNLDLSSKLNEKVAGGIVSNFITAQNTVSNAFFKPSSSFVSTPVDPESNQFGFAPWFRTSGGLSRDTSQGVAFLPTGTPQSVSSSVNVGFGGYQFGLDTGLFNIADKAANVHLGLTAGQVFGSASQVDYNNKTGMVDTFVGAYGVFSNGPFFVDAQLRQEFINYTVNVDDLLFRVDDSKVKAGRLSAGVSGGYAFKLNDWSIVPAAGYTYARTKTNDLVIVGDGGPQSPVITSFAESQSHLAFAGLSVARSYLLFDDRVRLSPFISATLYHDFGRPNEASLVIGKGASAATFDVSSRNGATYGEVSFGSNFLALTPKLGSSERLLTGNVRGDVQFGKGRLGGSLNLQMRLQF